MIGFDATARGLSAKARADVQQLSGADGAHRIGYRADIAQAALRPVAAILSAAGLAPEDFGALGDGDHADGEAMEKFAAAMAQSAHGISRLGSGTYALDRPLRWSASGSGMIGRGMHRTILANTGAGTGNALEFLGSCRDLYFADMTISGGFGGGSAQDIERVVFHRCQFTSRPDAAENAVKLVTDNMAGGIRSVYFIDCVFADAGRMNVELQNHRNDGVYRYADIHFIRPRFLRAGQVETALGMGISLTGKGENVTLDAPYFDGNSAAQLENAGCDRLLVRDAIIRAATVPVDIAPISFSARRMAYNGSRHCRIDGLRLASEPGEPAQQARIKAALYFEGCEHLTLRNLDLAVESEPGTYGRKVLSFSGTGIDADGVPRRCGPVDIEGCTLSSDAFNQPIIAFNSADGAQRIAGNTLVNTNASRAGPLVAAYAQETAAGYTVRVAGNRMTGAAPHSSASFVLRNNAASLEVGDDNDGMPTRQIVRTVVPAGSAQGPLVDLHLPTRKITVAARPLGPVAGGGVPYGSTHDALTRIRANLENAPSADVAVELEIRSEP